MGGQGGWNASCRTLGCRQSANGSNGNRTGQSDFATELLDRALVLFIDQRALVPAIVRTGAAEDVLHGYLLRNGMEPAHTNFARSASRISKRLDPATWDLEEEAEHMLSRARWQNLCTG